MPIRLYDKTENHGPVLEILLGYGDVGIGTAEVDDNGEPAFMFRIQQMNESKEIGTYEKITDYTRESVWIIMKDIRNAQMFKKYAEQAIEYFESFEKEQNEL